MLEGAKELKSKRCIVFSNQNGSRVETIEYQDPEGDSVSSNDYLSPIGIVYDHPRDVYGDRADANIVGLPITGNPAISDLVGKMLTIADAMFVDKEQRDAFKSLIKQTIYGYANDKELDVVRIYKRASK